MDTNSVMKYKWLWGLLLVLTLYFPFFLQLDTAPVRLWDESRLAINAVEMYHNGISLVTTYEGQPDMWNTKPPLMIWLQVMCMKVLGINELALRLPSAVSGMATCLLLVFFSRKITGTYRWGYIAAIVLACSAGFTRFHVTRTGDYDALLVLFTTLYAGVFFIHTLQEKGHRYWWVMCVALLLAVYTKGVSSLLLLPGMFVWAAVTGKLRWFFMSWQTWLGVIIVLAGIALFYIPRELLTPGYLQAVWDNELGGRYLQPLEGHGHGFWFYFEVIREMKHFHPWWILGLLSLCGVWFYADQRVRRWVSYCLIMSLVFMLVISFGKTKLDWYPAPVFPFLAIVAAFGILAIGDILKLADLTPAGFSRNWISFAAVFLILLVPYYYTVKRVYAYEYFDWERGYYELPEYIKHTMRKDISLDGYKLVSSGYVPHINFYEYMLKQKGVKLSSVSADEVVAGDTIVISQMEVLDMLKDRFSLQHISQRGETYIIKVEQ